MRPVLNRDCSRFFCTLPGSPTVQKSILLAAIQKEIQRHDLSYFVDEPPSVAQGGKGVVVAGCLTCKKRINTMVQFLDHLANDAMPRLAARKEMPVTSEHWWSRTAI
jgi:hypothetical protein